jgi:uncharacterized protein YcbX
VLISLFRYPLKSARGESLAHVTADEGGLRGDREWACLDCEGNVVSAKHPRHWGRLLQVRASYTPDTVMLAIPGHPSPLDIHEAELPLSTWLGRPVTLTRTAPPSRTMRRLWPEEPALLPSWAPDAVPGTEEAAAVQGQHFFDFGPLHLLTTGALSQLAQRVGHPVEPERFRPNLVLDLPEDPEPGTQLHLGDTVTIEVVYPTPRCLVPAQDPDGGEPDLVLLRTLAQRYRHDVAGLGQAACFGVYARVLVPGELSLDRR